MTYNEKIRWLMFNDHKNALMISECIDKIKIHDFCKRHLGVDICVPLLKTYTYVDNIDLNELPLSVVFKTNNGCNNNIIVKNSKNANIDIIKTKLRGWLDDDKRKKVSIYHRLIEPKCFSEIYLGNVIDYKLYCFNGKMHFILIKQKIGKKYIYNYYDRDLNFIHNSNDYEDPSSIAEKPKNYTDMILISEILSKLFRYVRVDLYNIGGKIYLGEMTFTEYGGLNPHLHKEFSEMLGKLIVI